MFTVERYIGKADKIEYLRVTRREWWGMGNERTLAEYTPHSGVLRLMERNGGHMRIRSIIKALNHYYRNNSIQSKFPNITGWSELQEIEK